MFLSIKDNTNATIYITGFKTAITEALYEILQRITKKRFEESEILKHLTFF